MLRRFRNKAKFAFRQLSCLHCSLQINSLTIVWQDLWSLRAALNKTNNNMCAHVLLHIFTPQQNMNICDFHSYVIPYEKWLNCFRTTSRGGSLLSPFLYSHSILYTTGVTRNVLLFCNKTWKRRELQFCQHNLKDVVHVNNLIRHCCSHRTILCFWLLCFTRLTEGLLLDNISLNLCLYVYPMSVLLLPPV